MLGRFSDGQLGLLSFCYFHGFPLRVLVLTYRANYLEHSVSYEHSLEQVFSDIDATTYEEDFFWVEFLLPPITVGSTLIKGMVMACGFESLDILAKMPEVQKYFNIIYTSQWASIPRNTWADGLLSVYPNSVRENWFRQTYPHRTEQSIVGTHEADFVNELAYQPAFSKRDAKPIEKQYDIVWASRFATFKNLPIVARALKIYHKKYNERLRVIMPVDPLWFEDKAQKRCFQELVKAFGHSESDLAEYVTLTKKYLSPYQMIDIYRQSKIYLLGSLFEGKNRCIHESLCCDVPVVCFQDFNAPIRGDTQIFPEGCGMLAPNYAAESLADTLHATLRSLNDFSPRKHYLSNFGGRAAAVNRALDALPYYRNTIPDYVEGGMLNNKVLLESFYHNYGVELKKYIYFRSEHVVRATTSPEAFQASVKYFLSRVSHRD